MKSIPIPRFLSTVLLGWLLLFGLAPSLWGAEAPPAQATALPTPPEQGTRVLLVTGMDLHAWKATTPVLKAQLEKDPRLKVGVSENPHLLASPNLQEWDVVVLHFMNRLKLGEASPGPEAQDNLRRFVEGGKGLVLVHFACGAWQDWPGFRDLVGRVWDPKRRGHDPRGKFRVEITDPDHPITCGMQAFETDDELYTCLVGERPIHVLATAKSKVDGKDYPMAFVLNPAGEEKGRVFHCVLGHDVKALEVETVGELFRRGTAWAAGLPPAPEATPEPPK